MNSVPMLQLLIFLVVLGVCVGSDDRGDEESGTEPVLGDLVVDLTGNIVPETRHHLLLERRQCIYYCLQLHRLLPHLFLPTSLYCFESNHTTGRDFYHTYLVYNKFPRP